MFNNLVSDNAMILAAGFGSRMKPLTDNLPKPLIEVGGISMLERIVGKLNNINIRKIIVNCHYLADKVIEHIAYLQIKFPNIEFFVSHETPEILGTGGGIFQVIDHFDKPFLVIDGDEVWRDREENSTLLELLSSYKDNMDALLLLSKVAEAKCYHGHGDFEIAQDFRIVKSDAPRSLVFMGIYIIKPAIVKKYGLLDHKFGIDKLLFSELEATQSHKIYGTIHQGEWFHVSDVHSLTVTQNYF